MDPGIATTWQAIGAAVTAVATVVLAAITWYYARTSRAILEASSRQAAAADSQARVMSQNLEHLRRAGVPEWELLRSTMPHKVFLEFRNVSDVMARRVSCWFEPRPGTEATTLRFDPAGARRVALVAPGDSFHTDLHCDGDGSWGAVLFVTAMGQGGLTQTSRWTLEVWRPRPNEVLATEARGPEFNYATEADA
jgi:hypothetical protein